MGADLDGLVASGRAMERDCRRPAAARQRRPGARGSDGRRDDDWPRQADAASATGLRRLRNVGRATGRRKHGQARRRHRAGHGRAPNAVYGADRFFVEVTFAGEPPDPATVARARATGAPRISIEVPRAIDLAAEFLRWEVATAITGLLLGVNPFDEPNVQQAKDATKALLADYTRDGRLPFPQPHVDGGRCPVDVQRRRGDGRRHRRAHPRSARVRTGDYLALLAYVPPDDPAWAAALDRARAALAQATGVVTTAAYGPRYLHSTGQLHKGGPNTGVFVVIAGRAGADLPVPGQPFSFGVLEAAQALGDFQSLDAGGPPGGLRASARRAIRRRWRPSSTHSHDQRRNVVGGAGGDSPPHQLLRDHAGGCLALEVPPADRRPTTRRAGRRSRAAGRRRP